MNDISQYVKLPRSFYVRSKVVEIAEELIGKYVFTNFNNQLTGGKIVETEAYNGRKSLETAKADERAFAVGYIKMNEDLIAKIKGK